ncbi:hypothetical protein IE077_000428 [Cardiosporidium cionae]|uniref:Auxin response factor domain-containing protein n=1 Tax=Cardiosporidium cionae TaxID=476202 RepID=A0ABQ7J4A3_9APIC|nr:hypothetical protein IE077_000428 [Cardiosporidium cionae]|eukprot:KAF8817907.1 hypothetical protein IE077_000428 [Cardiosporidium cionae]
MICIPSWKNLRLSWRRDVAYLMTLEQHNSLQVEGVYVQKEDSTKRIAEGSACPSIPPSDIPQTIEGGRLPMEKDSGEGGTMQAELIHGKVTEEVKHVYIGECEELICLLGLYFNFWKIYGLYPRKFQDIQTVVERETFLKLIDSTYRGSVPNKGDTLIYFKGGHRTIINTMQEYQLAMESEIPPSLYYVEEVIVEDIWYHSGKYMDDMNANIIPSPKISYSFIEDPIKLGLQSTDPSIEGHKSSSLFIKKDEDLPTSGLSASSSNLHLPSPEPFVEKMMEKEKEGMPYCRLWLNGGDSLLFPLFQESSKTRASSRIRGQPPPELAREAELSTSKEENWRDLEPYDSVRGERYAMFCLPLKNGLPEYFVSKEKFVSALNLGWKPGMRFKMFFQTEGEKGGTRFTGTIRKIDYEAKDLWECVLVEWDDHKKSSKKNLECVNLWELEPIKEMKCINGRLSTKS